MDLKTKLNNRLTAICQYNTETFAIFSDECSAQDKCLHILEGKDKIDVYNQAKELTIQLAATSRFAPVLMIISPTGQRSLKKLTPATEQYV
jgi:hypothetical protein